MPTSTPFAAKPISTFSAFAQLHISVLLAGFTGILGKLITMSEGLLVWYRMGMTMLLFAVILRCWGRLELLPLRDMARIGAVGVVLCLHWLFFYGSIKASNVSIGVVCFALIGLFTALIEPLVMHRRVSGRELFLSVFTLLGIALIFSFDTRYRLGIVLGVVSSLFAALFTVMNKRVCAAYSSSNLLLYAMLGGFAFLTAILPGYVWYFDITYLVPTAQDWLGLFLLSFFCTIFMYILQLQALRVVSAFTVNLSFNLEPVYSIAIAIAFMGEGRELNWAFYVGLAAIVLSVLLQMAMVVRERRAIPTAK